VRPDSEDRPAPDAESACGECGASLVELLVVMVLVAGLAGLSLPATARSIDAGRARDAAGFVAARLRLARQHAVFRTASVGLVFDVVSGRWVMRVCSDGNGNGLRRSEIAGGIDPCTEGPHDVGHLFPGVEPGSADPVRFGTSNMASFSPEGSGTAGTLYLRSAHGQQFAVRVGNITGRTRVLRYDPGLPGWRAG
jgi:Tfp pilus assembly protein FimT